MNKKDKNMKKYLFILMTALIAFGCEDWKDQYPDQLNPDNDGTAPAALVVKKIENVKGGAVIYYEKPTESDFLYVKAVYNLNESHQNVETSASYAEDHLVLEGFRGDGGDPIPVNLYVADRWGNLSDVVIEHIEPLPSAAFDVAASLTTEDAPGGIRVQWENPDMLDVALVISDSSSVTGYWEPSVSMYFNKTRNVKKVIKGFPMNIEFNAVDSTYEYFYPTINYKFEFLDKWDNYYVVYIKPHTPIVEYVISPYGGPTGATKIRVLFGGDNDTNPVTKNTWAERGDCGLGYTPFSNCYDAEGATSGEVTDYWWDNGVTEVSAYFQGMEGANGVYAPWPYYFTIDMGVTAIYSTFKLFIQQRQPLGSATLMKEFEIWGSNSIKPQGDITGIVGSAETKQKKSLRYWTSWDFVWDKEIHGDVDSINNPYNLINTAAKDYWETDGSWELLGDCAIELPDGSELDANNIPDIGLGGEIEAFLAQGIEFDINPDSKKYRFLRFKVKSTTSGDFRSRVDCLQFLGRYDD
jgi:hypothetical protein